MTRVLSALVLLPVVVGTIWFLPPLATLLFAMAVSLLAFAEYRTIARALGVRVDAAIGGCAVVLACAIVGLGGIPEGLPNVIELLFLATLIVVGANAIREGQPGRDALANAAATMFAPVYIGLPLGALAAVRGFFGAIAVRPELAGEGSGGRLVILLLLAVIVVSDSAQYYTGRAFGRRPLSPTISPKKTVEGAVGGVCFGMLAMIVGGHYVFATPTWLLAIVGAVISLLGIVGDLFESLLKRSAGVKDSSNLIPGHGGVLDRIDSWLFAAPVYYVFVRFVA